ncbi:hypothetical protein [Flavihumibacter sp.]|nr:hypothetical protein [Flavihumibacter sediminis]
MSHLPSDIPCLSLINDHAGWGDAGVIIAHYKREGKVVTGALGGLEG